MAIVEMKLPKCDSCGEVWLPDKRLPDGSTNPARQNPQMCKRCGKCKTPTWNKGGYARQKVLRRGTVPQGTGPSELRHQKPHVQANGAGLESLYGILEEEFRALGGGEAYLRAERASWGPDPWEKLETDGRAAPEDKK